MQDLIAPMRPDVFFADFFTKEPVHIRRGNSIPPLFLRLFTTTDLDVLLRGGKETVSRAVSLLSSNGISLQPQQLPSPLVSDGPAGTGNYTSRLLADGTTVRLKLEHFPPLQLPSSTRIVSDAINVMLGGTNTSKHAEDAWDGYELDGIDVRSTVHIYATGPQKGARGKVISEFKPLARI